MIYENIDIKPFHPDLINPTTFNYKDPNQGGSKIFVIGKPGSGKSNLIKALCYYKSGIIPVAEVISGTESETGFFSKFIPDEYIHDEYNSDIISNNIVRQKGMLQISNAPNKWILTIVDDCLDDRTVFNKPPQPAIFKNGRHWKMLYIVSLQYALDIQVQMRCNIDGVFLFREPNLNIRKKLYENYAGIIPDFKEFEKLMNEYTGNYTALYIKNDITTNDWKDCVFWFKAPIIPDTFKFGCSEYKGFAKHVSNKKNKG